MESGIKYCYVGNVHNLEGQTTYCPNCNEKLIKRDWHSVISNNLGEWKMPEVWSLIEGVFE